MNKLPAKQIYLLSIIIIGIIALSVYSTYALFTFESVTSDIVTIHTPKSLIISENIYEYQQITVEPNTVVTTDIDIYNSFDYDVCYSIWYKVVGENIDESKVQIFEKSNGTLTSNSTLTINNNIRVTLAIINDNDETVKINIGTIGAKQENNSCSLNLDTDKNLITSTYQFEKTLSEKILENKEEIKEEESNYITYKKQTDIITYKNTDKIYISEKFTYKNEIFTLEEPTQVTIEELIEEEYLGTPLEPKTVYFCKENNKCSILYKITEIKKQVEEEDDQNTNSANNNKEIFYNIEKYDKMIGYTEGTNGLRKINENDYVFYGDNPNNYVYYNCKNEDTSSCELWRIIGLYYDEKTKKHNIKLVRNESIGKYQFDTPEELEEESNEENIDKNVSEFTEESNEEQVDLTWTNSTLYKTLNREYKLFNNFEYLSIEHIPNREILSSLDEKIKKTPIDRENITLKTKEELEEEKNKELEENIENEIDLELEKLDETKLRINILSLEDYINTSSCKENKISKYKKECFTNNWLNNIEVGREWTLTEKEPVETIVEIPVTPSDEMLENEITNEDNPENQTEITEETTNEENTEIPADEIEEQTKTIITNYAYGIKEDIVETNVNELLDIRPVIYIKSRTLLIDGLGTFEKPYIIK